jgi:hypothetical protein
MKTAEKPTDHKTFDSFVHKIAEVIGESFTDTRFLLKDAGSFDALITAYLAGQELGLSTKKAIALKNEGDRKVSTCAASKCSGMRHPSQFN